MRSLEALPVMITVSVSQLQRKTRDRESTKEQCEDGINGREWVRRFPADDCVRRLDNIDYQLRRVSWRRIAGPRVSPGIRVFASDRRLFAVNRYLVPTSYVKI